MGKQRTTNKQTNKQNNKKFSKTYNYKKAHGVIQMDEVESQKFEVDIGLKRGDSLSLLLFIIVIERIIKNTRKITRNL